MDRVIQLISQDEQRVKALKSARQLGLPQCYLAAGFVRNLVWDHLHDKAVSTPLNDIDVIYFDSNEVDPNRHLAYEAILTQQMPELNWQVRNQAKMHQRNGDQPYSSVLDAMSYWPEKETAVGIRILTNGQYECISAFGFASLFQLQITYNSKRDRSVFNQRLKAKQWLQQWPKLMLVIEEQ